MFTEKFKRTKRNVCHLEKLFSFPRGVEVTKKVFQGDIYMYIHTYVYIYYKGDVVLH